MGFWEKFNSFVLLEIGNLQGRSLAFLKCLKPLPSSLDIAHRCAATGSCTHWDSSWEKPLAPTVLPFAFLFVLQLASSSHMSSDNSRVSQLYHRWVHFTVMISLRGCSCMLQCSALMHMMRGKIYFSFVVFLWLYLTTLEWATDWIRSIWYASWGLYAGENVITEGVGASSLSHCLATCNRNSFCPSVAQLCSKDHPCL